MDSAETELDGEQSDRGMKRILIVLTVISILGLLLGGTGLTIGVRANEELIQFRKEVNSRPNPAQELKTKVESLEKRLVKVGAETVRINNNLAALHDQTQRAFDDVSRQGRATREKLNEISKRIADSSETKAGPTTAEVAVTPSPEATETGNGASAEIPPDGYHAIQPGDNFSKLAVRYGSTVAEFMAANPGVDPRRLQIGQKVKIPE